VSGSALLPALLAAALLLVLAGAVKLRRPAPAVDFLAALGLPAPRLLVAAGAVLELAAGSSALVWPRTAAAGIALLFAAFAGLTALQLRRGVSVSCGCFGARTIPPSRVHLSLNLLGAAVGCAAAAAPPPAFASLAASSPSAAAIAGFAAAAVALLAGAAVMLFPETMGAWRGAGA
jgi:hypothetical protein